MKKYTSGVGESSCKGAGEFLRAPVLAVRPKVGNHEVTQDTYNSQFSFGKDFHAIFKKSKKEHDSS